MIRTTPAASALALVALAASAMAEIVPARCTLIRYDGMNTPPETFNCQFRQSGGNVTVDSDRWAFTFLAKDQGTGYIRINTMGDITFTRTGQYSLKVMQ